MTLPLTSIGLIFGGASGEHSVSIKSAITVFQALNEGNNKKLFEVICIYIDKEGRWWPSSVAEAVLKKGDAPEEKDLPLSMTHAGLSQLPEGSEKVHVWFPVLHGPNGEDGTVQGLFKLTGKPFVGSGVLGSALSMDKIAMKGAFSAAGLPQVPYCCADSKELIHEELTKSLITRLENFLGYPCFIKPANLGSSVGITKAYNRKQLLQGLTFAAGVLGLGE